MSISRECSTHLWSRRAALGVAASGLAVAAPLPADALVPSKWLRIDRDTRLSGAVTIASGSGFVVGTGATLTFDGDLTAPSVRIFDGPGRVDLGASRVAAARPEWWGATANDAACDCSAALAACLAAHPVLQLGRGDYYLESTWKIDRPGARVAGVGGLGVGGTRLVLRGGVGAVVLVGTEDPPAQINDYLRGVELRDIALGRTSAPTSESAVGLAVRHVLLCNFEGLDSDEHAIGYSIKGAVRTFLRGCAALRTASSETGHGDSFVAFELDGRSSPIPTGANASLYLIDCLARTGGRPTLTTSVGCRMRGGFSDTFIIRFETTELAVGILVDGEASLRSADETRLGHVDLHIEGPVLDQCSGRGIAITGLGGEALVEIARPYVALAPGGRVGIDIDVSGGNIGLVGGQLLGWVAAGHAVGLRIAGSRGIEAAGIKLLGFGRPVEVLASRGLDLVLAINNRAGEGGPAIRVERSDRVYLRPRIAGGSTAFDVGVAIDGASRNIVIEGIGIDDAAARVPVAIAGRPVALDRAGRYP